MSTLAIIALLCVGSVVSAALLTRQHKITATGATAGDHFGKAVGVSGSTVVAGIPNDDDRGSASGSAQVFVQAGTSWIYQAKLLAADGKSSDHFGSAVAIDGDTVVIGSPDDDDKGSGCGSAYIYLRTGTTWKQQAKLVAADGASSDHFGHAVDIDGDLVVVGAPNDDDKGSNSGSMYLFRRTAGNWVQEAKITDVGGASSDYLGHSVAVSGSTVLGGAYGDDDRGAEAGAALVFVKGTSGWLPQGRLLAKDAAKGDRLGYAVDLDGERAALGAYRDDDKGSSSGSAYVFVRASGKWSQEGKVVDPAGKGSDAFGEALAISGKHLLVGAWGDDDKGSSAGSAVIYVRGSTGWAYDNRLLAADAKAGDWFGRAVALDGYTTVSGAESDDDSGSSSGSAYITMLLLPSGRPCTPPTARICNTGFCVDDVCCSTACGGNNTTDCQACAVAAGAKVNGTCDTLPSTMYCRMGAGPCDAVEKCDGVNTACPWDQFLSASNVCRTSSGICDIAEYCTGTGASCPVDRTLPDGTKCRAGTGQCKGGKCVPLAAPDKGTVVVDQGQPDRGAADSTVPTPDQQQPDSASLVDSTATDQGRTDGTPGDSGGAQDIGGAGHVVDSGCDCRLADSASGENVLPLLALVLFWVVVRRRRSLQGETSTSHNAR